MIEGFWVRNYRSLKQLGIGSCFELFSVVDGNVDIHPFELGPVTVFSGDSGAGKNTVFDALTFLADCFHNGLDYACLKRGGFQYILHQGAKDSFSVGIDCRFRDDIASYAVAVGCDKHGIPFIESEILAVRHPERSFPVIFLQNGVKSIRYLAPNESISSDDRTKIEFTDYKHLGLSGLKEHPGYPVFGAIRNLFDNWLLCGLATDPLGDPDEKRYDAPRGRSLSGLVRTAVTRYGDVTPRLLERVTRFLPNVEEIFLNTTSDGTPKLTFKMLGLDRPIPMVLLPDATRRLLAYSLLMEEEDPVPLIVVKEPECGFDRPHLEKMNELIRRVIDFPRQLQLFLSTRTPELFETIPDSSVWYLEKRSGEHIAERACD
jgi:predicted ATPase